MPDGQPGELLVRRKGAAPRLGFFSEYYKNPGATAEAWENGWFHTGDIVRKGEDGFFFFVDRKKNVIRRSGENIAAVEVESILARHPDVKAAAVAPVPDAVRGDEVFACLSVADPNAAKAHEIVTWALGQMAYYKVPGYVAFTDDIPLTATQKIQRAALKVLGRGIAGRSAHRRHHQAEEKAGRMIHRRQSYDGVALVAPVSMPYQRYSIETAHWWIARALRRSLDKAAG